MIWNQNHHDNQDNPASYPGFSLLVKMVGMSRHFEIVNEKNLGQDLFAHTGYIEWSMESLPSQIYQNTPSWTLKRRSTLLK